MITLPNEGASPLENTANSPATPMITMEYTLYTLTTAISRRIKVIKAMGAPL